MCQGAKFLGDLLTLQWGCKSDRSAAAQFSAPPRRQSSRLRECLEVKMSARFNLNVGPVVTGVLIVLPILLCPASAQMVSNPKEDLFVGYQGPDPGAVPAPSAAPSAICAVQPNEVIVGEPITATVTPDHFNPKHTLTYIWSPSNGGGKIDRKST